jgi:hypothetical protein
MSGCLVLQVFPNLFLVEIWKIISLWSKKFGFAVFPEFATLLTPAALRYFVCQQQTLARFHIFGNDLSRPARIRPNASKQAQDVLRACAERTASANTPS